MAHDALRMIEYRDDPGILVFADTEEALGRARRSAEIAGCRIVAASIIADGAEPLRGEAATYPVLAELAEPAKSEAAARLLDRLRLEAEHGRRRSVVVAARELTDLVAARAWHRDIVHQCEPDEAERMAAVVRATRPPPPRLNDVGRESNALLQQLSQEVGRIANILASMSDEDEGAEAAPRLTGEGDEPPVEAAFVRSLIRARRLRDQYFRGELFADPAWDMLLDLMAARLEGNRVAVSSLCIAAAVPATTALRWIKALTDRGLFIRSADPEDGRRVYIELSDETARALTSYLRAAQRIAPTVI